MLTFLFWNTRGNGVQALISEIVRLRAVDVVVLAEPPRDRAATLLTLSSGCGEFFGTFSTCPSIQIFARQGCAEIETVEDWDRWSIRRISWPYAEPTLLVAAHLPSKRYSDKESQHEAAIGLASALRAAERRESHHRTVLVGDLNMDPFESGMVGPMALHAVMTREISLRTRTVRRQEWPCFYNPMWRHFGDGNSGSPGSYYYDGGPAVRTYWHLFDQVLVRPALLDRFDPAEVEILTVAGETSLVNERGIPLGRQISDHLPLLFRLH